MVVGARASVVGCEYEILEEDDGKRRNGEFVDLKYRYYSDGKFAPGGLEGDGRIAGAGLA